MVVIVPEELGLPLMWNEGAGYRKFSKLIKLDATLLGNSKKLSEAIEKMQKNALGGRSGSMVRNCATLKKYITDLLTLFKRRRHVLGS